MLKTVGYLSTRTGDQTIVNGNLVIGTAGKGIDFSADPHTTGMTSELLDDYEEGTWTPSLGGNATYLTQVGKYTKIGDTVYIYCALRPNVLGTGSPTDITGLPFAAISGERNTVSVGFFDLLPNNVISMGGFLIGSTITVYGKAVASSSYLGVNIFGDGSRVWLAGVYKTA